jgi:hypothetical protein
VKWTIPLRMICDGRGESPSLAGGSRLVKGARLRTATKIAAIPVIVALLMLSSSGPEPLDHDVPEAKATAEEFAATWLDRSSARAVGYASDTSGINVEQLDGDREYFVSLDFEIVGPARFVRNTFVGLPGYVLPMEGFQGTHRLPHSLVVVMTRDWQGWRVMAYGWGVDDPYSRGAADQ